MYHFYKIACSKKQIHYKLQNYGSNFNCIVLSQEF